MAVCGVHEADPGALQKAVQLFFSSGRLLKVINHASLSLVSKIPNPSSLDDYRLISCYNTLYKCINKILASWIKVVLGTLIDSA